MSYTLYNSVKLTEFCDFGWNPICVIVMTVLNMFKNQFPFSDYEKFKRFVKSKLLKFTVCKLTAV